MVAQPAEDVGWGGPAPASIWCCWGHFVCISRSSVLLILKCPSQLLPVTWPLFYYYLLNRLHFLSSCRLKAKLCGLPHLPPPTHSFPVHTCTGVLCGPCCYVTAHWGARACDIIWRPHGPASPPCSPVHPWAPRPPPQPLTRCLFPELRLLACCVSRVCFDATGFCSVL